MSAPFQDAIPLAGAAEVSSGRPIGVRKISEANTTSVAAANRDAAAGPYDLSNSANRTLSISFSTDNGGSYKKVTITGLVGAVPAATTAAELAALLNANAVFSKYFTASNSAGTLRTVAKMWSSRFKWFYTGTAAAQLAGIYTTAVAIGSATNGSAQAGALLEVEANDMAGNPVANWPVFVSGQVAGVAVVTPSFGIPTKGEQVSNAGHTGVEFRTDNDGRLAFYVVDSAAEALAPKIESGSVGKALSFVLGTTLAVTVA